MFISLLTQRQDARWVDPRRQPAINDGSLTSTPLPYRRQKKVVQKGGHALLHLILTLAALAVTERIWSPFFSTLYFIATKSSCFLRSHAPPASSSCENSQRALCRTYPPEVLRQPGLANLGRGGVGGRSCLEGTAVLHYTHLMCVLSIQRKKEIKKRDVFEAKRNAASNHTTRAHTSRTEPQTRCHTRQPQLRSHYHQPRTTYCLGAHTCTVLDGSPGR